MLLGIITRSKEERQSKPAPKTGSLNYCPLNRVPSRDPGPSEENHSSVHRFLLLHQTQAKFAHFESFHLRAQNKTSGRMTISKMLCVFRRNFSC